MPLYELTVITKVGESQALGEVLRKVVGVCYAGNGVLRNVKNMGERIAARAYKDKSNTQHDFVRFLNLHIDADPLELNRVREMLKTDDQVLFTYVHKIKNEEYYKEVIDKEYMKSFDRVAIDEDKRNKAVIEKHADLIAEKMLSKSKQNNNNDKNLEMKFDIKQIIQKSINENSKI